MGEWGKNAKHNLENPAGDYGDGDNRELEEENSCVAI